ncbi:MAG: hypothetical protein IVW57_13225 [Ktedonobacterales bacterium]|nr:hypothetical protein [Ktedonobacterales bacterium]
MGVRDLPFWGRVAAELADAGLDRMGAKRCAVKGHKWRDVGAVMLREDGGVDELARGAMQRCRRCGTVQPKPRS